MNCYQQEIINLKAKVAGLEKVNTELMIRLRDLERVESHFVPSKENLERLTKLSIDAYHEYKKTGIIPGRTKLIFKGGI